MTKELENSLIDIAVKGMWRDIAVNSPYTNTSDRISESKLFWQCFGRALGCNDAEAVRYKWLEFVAHLGQGKPSDDWFLSEVNKYNEKNK